MRIVNKLIVKLTEYLMKRAEKKDRIFKITGTSGPDDVYLIRYYIIQSKYFNFFIHQFLRSDRDDLHDHPWSFCTYLVRGSYTERMWSSRRNDIVETYRCNHDLSYLKNPVKLNTLVFRKATDQHQVVVDRDLKESEKDEAALTLCFTGPTKREWGFIREEMSPFLNDRLDGKKVRVWVPWKKYLGLPDDAPGRG